MRKEKKFVLVYSKVWILVFFNGPLALAVIFGEWRTREMLSLTESCAQSVFNDVMRHLSTTNVTLCASSADTGYCISNECSE